jgi:hypothetical protein
MSKVCDHRNDCGSWEDEPIGDLCSTNECQINNGGCADLCVDLPNGFYCTCQEGYELVDNTCVDINECKTIPGICSQRCDNLPGTYKCTCQEGYLLEHGQICRATGPQPVLIFANRHDIRSYNLISKHSGPLYSDLASAVALDFDNQTHSLIWTDVGEERIYRGSLDGDMVQGKESLMDHVETADGVAMDWIYRKVYWTDTGNNTVGVTCFNTGASRTLFNSGIDEPRAIVVDPETG